jgi:hypothetical protein
MNILEILDYLDGSGIVITDMDLVKQTLDEMGIEYTDKSSDAEMDEINGRIGRGV